MKILSFQLSDQLFGIDIKVVKEIHRHVCLTPVPTADPQIEGLYNLRGQVVTILDMMAVLNCEKRGLHNENSGVCILLKPKNSLLNMVGFLADTAEDVLNINEDMITQAPPHFNESLRWNLLGVVPQEHGFLLLLDKNKLFNFDATDLWREE